MSSHPILAWLPRGCTESRVATLAYMRKTQELGSGNNHGLWMVSSFVTWSNHVPYPPSAHLLIHLSLTCFQESIVGGIWHCSFCMWIVGGVGFVGMTQRNNVVMVQFW